MPHLASALADCQQQLADLGRELAATSAAAAVWQERAQILAAELAAARDRLALVEGERQADTAADAPRHPWWAFWRR